MPAENCQRPWISAVTQVPWTSTEILNSRCSLLPWKRILCEILSQEEGLLMLCTFHPLAWELCGSECSHDAAPSKLLSLPWVGMHWGTWDHVQCTDLGCDKSPQLDVSLQLGARSPRQEKWLIKACYHCLKTNKKVIEKSAKKEWTSWRLAMGHNRLTGWSLVRRVKEEHRFLQPVHRSSTTT